MNKTHRHSALALSVTLLASLTATYVSPAAFAAGDSGTALERRGRGNDDGAGHDAGDDSGGRRRGGRSNGGSGNGGGGGSETRVRHLFALISTSAGRPLGLKGKAVTETRSRAGRATREKVNVEVESRKLQPGIVLGIWIVNPANTTSAVFLSNVTLRRNAAKPREVRGEVEINTGDGDTLPAGASPVSRITEFRVVDPTTGEVLLQSAPR